MQKGACPHCHHPMRLHKTVKVECTVCACGEEFIVVDDLTPENVWYELGVTTVIALVIIGAVLVTIRVMEGWLVPW